MKNYIQKGETIKHVAAAAIASGDVVVKGALIGIATADIANGDTGDLAVSGVYSVPKNTAEALTIGASVTLDVSTGEFRLSGFVTAAGDIVNAGVVWKAAGAADATVEVKINALGATIA